MAKPSNQLMSNRICTVMFAITSTIIAPTVSSFTPIYLHSKIHRQHQILPPRTRIFSLSPPRDESRQTQTDKLTSTLDETLPVIRKERLNETDINDNVNHSFNLLHTLKEKVGRVDESRLTFDELKTGGRLYRYVNAK